MKKTLKIIQKLFVIIALSSIFLMPVIAGAASMTELQRQKEEAARQAAEARKQAELKQQEASFISGQISNIDGEISGTEKAIKTTNDQISSTQNQINDLDAKIKIEENNLANEKIKMNRIISAWYMEGSEQGLMFSLVSSNNLSEAVTKEEYYDSIRQQIESSIGKINTLKIVLNTKKDEQSKQLASLQSLKDDQENQQAMLENRSTIKKQLLSNTKSTITDLKEQEQSAQARMADLQKKIDSLIITKNWGGEILSSNDGSWFYSQLDYPSTYLGNSPYSVAQYGCLITSFAMVAKYYGNNVTPATIANNTSIFDYNGYLLVNTPPGIGIVANSSSGIDWSVVDQEVEAGHPVIVSIYLPSVGAINRDGSSHFIVIKGKSGGKYLMHDPLGGGRGYNMNQVRSMKIIRPY